MERELNLLIVDDDDIDRMAVRRALKSAGVQAAFTETGSYAETISILETQLFDCIFLDYRLPDEDGLALVQAIRKLGILSPLIMLTGQGDDQIAVELMKAGATDYLSKSRVDSVTLSQTLRNALRVYEAEVQTVLANQRLQESYELLVHKNQELEQQRQQIQLQNLELVAASQLKSRFLATISHELKTPLNIIIGFSQMLLRPTKGALSQKQSEMVQRIFNNGKHLLEMLNEILEMLEIEAGHMDLKPNRFNLEQVVNSAVEEVRSLAEQKQLNLYAQMSLTHPEVFNDPKRLRQILVSLLSNAIKFTVQGSVHVEVQEVGSDRILLCIHDTGIGMTEADLSNIFEAFRQIDQTNTRRHSGTGLGLAITDALVRIMSGTISVESQVGQGSTFRIDLPRSIPALTHTASPHGLANRSKSSQRISSHGPVITDVLN